MAIYVYDDVSMDSSNDSPDTDISDESSEDAGFQKIIPEE